MVRIARGAFDFIGPFFLLVCIDDGRFFYSMLMVIARTIIAVVQSWRRFADGRIKIHIYKIRKEVERSLFQSDKMRRDRKVKLR